MRYDKPARGIGELISLMKERGLIIESDGLAEEFLERVSFFRLKGYLLHFEKKCPANAEKNTHKVPEGTTFNSVMAVYELDRKLRLLMFEAIEKIEICFRSSICSVYCVGYSDPHWLLRCEHFDNPSTHTKIISRIKREIGMEPRPDGSLRDKEIFVDHYIKKYTEPDIPPSWVIAECLPLGVWSQIYEGLVCRKATKRISQTFQVPPPVLGNWMHSLTVNRNICAHHGRVWNRAFAIHPETLPEYEHHFSYPGRFYSQAFITAYLLRRIYPATEWHLRMKEAMLSCPSAEKMAMGLFNNWEKQAIWTNDPLPKHEVKTIAPRGRD